MLGGYDILMRTARNAVLAVSALAPDESAAKFMRFGRGQRRITGRIARSAATLDRTRPTVWIHAASLGEFGIARPVIRGLKEQTGCNIVVTFFSPTGYEALTRHPGDTDRVYYLPLDTRRNARRFLDAVKPDCAVFMVSEYWPNFLTELRRRDIPTFLVSAIIRDNGPFFKWYGSLFRRSLRCFTRIFTLDPRSVENLGRLGIDSATVNGDPLFDNVSLVAATPWTDPVIENYAAGRKVFLAGSVHVDKDMEIVCSLCNSRKGDTPFVIAPHEITPGAIEALRRGIKGEVRLYSECDGATDFSATRALIIDNVGSLAYIYRYAGWAYVGGGFTRRLLHSVIEPVVYGIPVAYGPNIERKVVASTMVRLGLGTVVTNAAGLERWFASLRDDHGRLAYIAKKARKFVEDNSGATPRIINHIARTICGKN